MSRPIATAQPIKHLVATLLASRICRRPAGLPTSAVATVGWSPPAPQVGATTRQHEKRRHRMITQNQVRELIGSQLVDSSDAKVGKVGQIYLDDQTGQPEWATVNTGLFGSSESFVPLAKADVRGDKICVPYTKDQIKDAPNVSSGDAGHLDQSEERNLYQHYGLNYTENRSDS